MSAETGSTRGLIQNILLVNTIAYIFTIIIGIIGNLWVAWKVGLVLLYDRRAPPLSRHIQFYIFAICWADLLVLVDLVLLVHFRLTDQWIFGKWICKAFYCIEILNKFVIPLGLVQISRLSYRSVRNYDNTHPTGYLIWGVYTVALYSVLLLTVYVAYISETNKHVVKRNEKVTEITVCNFNPAHYYLAAFNILAFLIGYIFTSASYVYFYANVPLVLKRRYSSGTPAAGKSQLNDQSLLKIRRTVTAFVIVYLSCWTPYWIFFWILSTINIVDRWVFILSTFTHLLPFVSCTAYPVILTAMNKSIQRAHSNIFYTKKQQLRTIRKGASQALSAHLSMVHTWIRVEERHLKPHTV